MARVWWCWAILGLLGALGCTPIVASYPSWEPTAPSVPPVTDRRVALVDLEQSRQFWLARQWASYSYVRALQISTEELRFTLLVVKEGRVVERALLASRVGERGLGDRAARKRGQVPQLLWREEGAELGQHREGAPVATVDQLYEQCRERVLAVRSEHAPRLSFHRDGLLQHCAFSRDDCPDCPVVSIQAVAPVTPQPWQTLPDLLCTDRYGLFLQGQSPESAAQCEMCRCDGHNMGDPNPPPKPQPTPEQLQRCAEADEDCPLQESVGDICKLDPSACPRDDRFSNRANWSCMWLLMADCYGGYYPSPDCLALPHPTGVQDLAWRARCMPDPHFKP